MAKLEVIEPVDEQIKQLKIIGRLDIQGTGEVELDFTAQTASKKENIIIDLSELDFITSVGIRILLVNAKAQSQHGGKLVLVNPKPFVEDILTTTGINKIIPVYAELTTAIKHLKNNE